MASRSEFQAKPEVGDILVVIHDFLARSSDELSLAKGDRIKLIERDDEFGDGWFLGKHLNNDNSGLFPEGRLQESNLRPQMGETNLSAKAAATASDVRPATSHGSTTKPDPVTLPLNSAKPESKPLAHANSNPLSSSRSASGSSGLGVAAAAARLAGHGQSQDSPVLHETLTVIDEHMNDLHGKPNNRAPHAANDSSSEYSAPLHDRLSYIQGEETDEEEDDAHTRAQVESWNADDVAEYLFTIGVDKKHCEVFRDQEITGEVLLSMDQSSLFLKAFDLGSVGRRLKTWQKVKNLQDEVNGILLARRNTASHASDAGSEGSRMRSRTNTLTNASKMGSMDQGRRLSQSTPMGDPLNPMTPISPHLSQGSPTQTSHLRRPSAASVRDLHHSRRHSSTDYRLTGTTVTGSHAKLSSAGSLAQKELSTHRKQPSFDRNWTMGGAATTAASARPLSSAGLQDLNISADSVTDAPGGLDLDRGYFSGTEVDGRNKRNTLKKRGDSLAGHSQKGSYTEEQRVRSATALSRHSRFGSVDSSRDPPTAAQMYYGRSASQSQRRMSTATTDSFRPVPPMKDGPAPTVTKLNNGEVEGSPPPISPANRQALHGDWLAKPAKMSGFSGLRAISDAVTGTERAKLASPSDGSLRDSAKTTGSSTPSGGPSLDLESPGLAKSPLSAAANQNRKAAKQKTKQETSAYQRGLLKISPREAVKGADYSGWMKKKNSNLMTTWKPRLFVLKGRRLSYFYSEDDTEEKGLIDISFHRVLPADTDRLTGLHATITGAGNTPVAPADSDLASETLEKGDDAMFIFKLMPPRAGLSRAVNFTKPTVHYFACSNLKQGRLWMAALMKATIDRDDTKPMTSTYQQKTISLTKARQMRHRPPALMNLDEKAENPASLEGDDEKQNGLGISFGEVDSAVSGLEKLGLQRMESASARKPAFEEKGGNVSLPVSSPQSA
ncbi:SAM domain-containing protein [Apiospora aurea]|uniref:SAM domain-containing protein n=1 Tax=Apiospora aurea TaxID=335848 RepID=A0ABR1PZ70_9PEZI